MVHETLFSSPPMSGQPIASLHVSLILHDDPFGDDSVYDAMLVKECLLRFLGQVRSDLASRCSRGFSMVPFV